MSVENELKDSMSASNYSGFEPDVNISARDDQGPGLGCM